MIYELVVTSVPRGLQAGRSGFTTVQRTRGIHPDLCNRLEAASGYRHVLSPGDPRNPQIRSHAIVQTPAGQMCVLSRIIDAGNDYSGRSNKLAHHLAFDAAEVAARAKTSPAAVLLAAERAGLFLRQWAGEPREQPASPAVPSVPVEPGPCAAWSRVAGDGGWAGFIADRALRKEPTWIIAPPGVDLVELFAEALALVNYPQRWSISFTTYALTAGDGLWLGTVDGSPEAQAARGQQRIAVVDLVRRPPLTVQSPTIDAARGTGQVPWKRDVAKTAAAAPANAVAAGLPIGAPIEMPPSVAPLVPGGPPALGGPMAPPPMAGPPGAPPPTVNRLGGPPVTRGWGASQEEDFLPGPSRPGGVGTKVIGIAIALLILVGLGVTVWLQPKFAQQLVAFVGGGKDENKIKAAAKGPSAHPPPATVPSPAPPPPVEEGQEEPAARTPATPVPQPESPQPPPSPPEKKLPTPAEKWKAFQAERAQPRGRYPRESLDGGKLEAQKARICEVGDIEFELLLPTQTFEPGLDGWQLACGRPDKEKREWVIECMTWQRLNRDDKKSHRLGEARVENDGWLVVALEPQAENRNVRAAREALTCAPLTLKTPLHPKGGPELNETWVQLRRPAVYGPIVIKKFFANKAIWPKGKVKDGKWPPGEFVPIPGVAVPANPWAFGMTTGKGAVVLDGGGDRKPQVENVIPRGGGPAAGVRLDPCGTQIFWQASFSKERNPVVFLRTEVEFQRVDGAGGDVFGVRIGNAAIETASVKYDLLAHLNKASALEHGEIGADRLNVDEFFPITKRVIDDFRRSQLDAVAYATMNRFVQAWLPHDSFPTDQSRAAVIRDLVAGRDATQAMSLENWAEAFRGFVASHQLYHAWCEPPGPGPGPQPADEKQMKDWQAKLQKWQADQQAFQKRLQEDRTKTSKFAAWLNQPRNPPSDPKVVAALQAVCTAIEKLPEVVTGKQKTLALLESMQGADLEMTGALVVWWSTEPAKQCVLASFEKDREPVTVSAETDSKDRKPAENASRSAKGPDVDPPQSRTQQVPFGS
jgi:hypothetical protein